MARHERLDGWNRRERASDFSETVGSAVDGGRRVRTAFLVGLLGALALAVLGALVRHEPIPHGDDRIYEDMARDPFGTHTFPFGYRMGLPLLVHLLPLGSTTGFLLLAWLAAGGAAAFAYLLMRELGAAQRVAVVLALLMCLSPPFLVVVIRQGRNTDIATVFFMMAATYFLVRGADWWLAVTLLLGATVREAVLFVIPLAYAWWAVRPFDLRAAGRTLRVGLPAIVAYGAIRLGIDTVGEGQVPGYGGGIVGQRLMVIKQGLQTPFQEARRIFSVYGPLWLTAPLALRDTRFARRGLVLAAACLVAMTFALDWGRMILLAAPVFYPASALVLSRRPRWFLPVACLLALLALGYAVYMDASGVQSGIVENPPPPYPVR